jgi:hypothetical protein
MRDDIAIVASEAMTHEANRLKLHAVTIISPPDGYHSSTLEVAYALSQQLHVPRHNIRVSRLRLRLFLVDFMMSPECARALCKGYIEAARSPLSSNGLLGRRHGANGPRAFLVPLAFPVRTGEGAPSARQRGLGTPSLPLSRVPRTFLGQSALPAAPVPG